MSSNYAITRSKPAPASSTPDVPLPKVKEQGLSTIEKTNQATQGKVFTPPSTNPVNLIKATTSKHLSPKVQQSSTKTTATVVQAQPSPTKQKTAKRIARGPSWGTITLLAIGTVTACLSGGVSGEMGLPVTNPTPTFPGLTARTMCRIPNTFATEAPTSSLNYCPPSFLNSEESSLPYCGVKVFEKTLINKLTEAVGGVFGFSVETPEETQFREMINQCHFDEALKMIKDKPKAFEESTLKWAMFEAEMNKHDDLVNAIKDQLRLSSEDRDKLREIYEEKRRYESEFTSKIYGRRFEEALKFLQNGSKPLTEDSLEFAQRIAAEHGNLAIVKKINQRSLLPVTESNYGYAIKMAVEHGHLSILHILVDKTKNLAPKELSKILNEALTKANRAGDLETTRYLCECTALSIEDKISVVKKGAASSHSHIMEYMLTQVPPTIAEQAFLHAASQGSLDVVTQLFQSFNFSGSAKDNALIKAAEGRHEKTVKYLLTKKADVFAHQHAINYIVQMGLIPPISKQWLDSLSQQNKQMALEANLKHHLLSTEFFQMIVDQIPHLNNTQLYPLIEQMMAHHHFDVKMIDAFTDRLKQLPKDHLYRLLRLALIKNDPAELYTKMESHFGNLLTDEHRKQFLEIQKMQAAHKEVQFQTKKQILNSMATRTTGLSSSEQAEKRISERVKEHADELLQIYPKVQKNYGLKDLKNVHFYAEEHENVIFTLNSLPGIIFKVSKDCEDKHTRTAKALKVCQDNNLNHLRIPHNVVISELNGQPVKFLAEEMLDVVGHNWEDYDDRLRMMNADHELLPIVNEYFRQLTLFTIKTGWSDIKPDNAGWLRDGAGIGILDLDILDTLPITGLYTFQPPKNVIANIYTPNFKMLRETLLKEDPERSKDIDFNYFEGRRQWKIDWIAKQRRLWPKHGVVKSTDPIDYDPRLLSALSPDDQVRAKSLIRHLNWKLARKEFSLETRLLTIQYDKVRTEGHEGWNLPYDQFFEKYKEILNYLTDKEIVMLLDINNGYGTVISC